MLIRGVGTAAAAAAMAAAHSGPSKRAGQLYSINAHAHVYDFPAGLESSSIWTRRYFKKYSRLSTMTRDAKVSSCFFFFFVVSLLFLIVAQLEN